MMRIKEKLFKLFAKIFKSDIFCADLLAYLYGSESLPGPLTADEETAVLARMTGGDESAKAALIEKNLRLVVYISRKFENTGVDIEDLISVGTIGLIKAVNSFDCAKKNKFATFASRCVENEILMYLRRVVRQKGEVSFDEPLNIDGDGNALLLSDILGTDAETVSKNIETTMENELLWSALNRLTDREKRIMCMRFGLAGAQEKTQKEVADMLGISQSYISRLEKKIISRLKKDIAKTAV
ncbi:MAG: RNA polymerase sporulation sigma factor SigE [Firmicutes bacterium]|nr:RNA polymerase sporulation sigma factor SigE [Bacillota bacterium]